MFAGKGRVNEAEEALCWLRGWTTPVSIQTEFQEILKSVESQSASFTNGDTSFKEAFKIQLHKFSKKTFIRPFILVLSCFFISNMSGTPTLSTFAVGIFATLGSPINKYYATVMLGAAQIIGSLSCASIIHYTGKKKLAIVSTIGHGLLFGLVGFYAYFYANISQLDDGTIIKENFADSENKLAWVPLVGLVGGALFAYTGSRLLPWIIIGEIFPADIRALASGIGASMFYVFAFTANKSFFSMVDYFTLPGVYWFYSFLALVGALLYYFALPETEGWSLLEVQEHFEGKRNLIHAGKRKKSCSSVVGFDNMAMNEVSSKL